MEAVVTMRWGGLGATGVGVGAGLALGCRALLTRALLAKFRADVKRLNGGDYSSLLAAYREDAVLHFHDGPHRWSGDWQGREGIERFLRAFVAAGIQGEIVDVAIAGPPWATTLWARFNDHVDAPDGTRIYDNRAVLVVRTRWGKIAEHSDFFADTAAILALEHALAARGD
jgi:ketosteroid isomerase-like protein